MFESSPTAEYFAGLIAQLPGAATARLVRGACTENHLEGTTLVLRIPMRFEQHDAGKRIIASE
jgi:hypothetical protein